MASAVQGVAGSGGRAAGGYLGAARRGLRRAGVAGRAVRTRAAQPGNPTAPDERGRQAWGRRSARLGGWRASKHHSFPSYSPAPLRVSLFLFPRSPFFLPFLITSSILFPPFPLFLPSFPFFISLLKERGIVGNPSVLPTWKKL